MSVKKQDSLYRATGFSLPSDKILSTMAFLKIDSFSSAVVYIWLSP